jgi:hypothetical protein
MNNSKFYVLIIICTTIAILVYLILRLMSTYILKYSAQSNKSPISYSIWFFSVILGLAIPLHTSINIIIETIDGLYKINQPNLYLNVTKSSTIAIGLSFGWFTLWYFLSTIFTALIEGKMRDQIAIENETFSHFIIKGSLLIGFTISFFHVHEYLVRFIMPNYLTQIIY